MHYCSSEGISDFYFVVNSNSLHSDNCLICNVNNAMECTQKATVNANDPCIQQSVTPSWWTLFCCKVSLETVFHVASANKVLACCALDTSLSLAHFDPTVQCILLLVASGQCPNSWSQTSLSETLWMRWRCFFDRWWSKVIHLNISLTCKLCTDLQVTTAICTTNMVSFIWHVGQ